MVLKIIEVSPTILPARCIQISESIPESYGVFEEVTLPFLSRFWILPEHDYHGNYPDHHNSTRRQEQIDR